MSEEFVEISINFEGTDYNVQTELSTANIILNDEKSPLREDRILEGFRPISNCFKKLDMKIDEISDDKMEKLLRARRITDFGSFITDLDVNNSKLMIKIHEGDGVTFEPSCIQPDPTDALLEEMKSFKVSDSFLKISKVEKKGGILKPQGSLEKAREERELSSTSSSSSSQKEPVTVNLLHLNKKEVKNKRSQQNVALQSIIKKLEESKQVKFNVDDKGDVELKNQSQFPQLRTQSFNQNHPVFPNQQDYLSSLRNIAKPPPQTPYGNVPPPMWNMPPPPYPNMQFPPHPQQPPARPQNNSFGMKMEEPLQNWCQNYQRPSDYHHHQQQQHHHHNQQMNYRLDFRFPPPSVPSSDSNQAAGDMFGGWNSISMRQAMLKETPPPPPLSSSQRQNPLNSGPGGYSLFNTNNTWTPDLGQLRSSNKPQDNSNSLFNAPGPRSLAQLLEQQSQKND